MKTICILFIFSFIIYFFNAESTIAQSQIINSTSIPIADTILIPLTLKLPYGELIAFVPYGQQQTTIIKYDADLKPIWSKIYPLNYQIITKLNGFAGEELYFYYNRTDSLLRVIAINLATGRVRQIDCPNLLEDDFQVRHFATLPNVLLFSKEKNNANSVLHFDLTSGKAKILSNTNFVKANFVEMKTDPISNTFGLIMNQKDGYWFNFYNAKGEMLFNNKVSVEDSKHKFITQRIFIKDAENQYITGLFGANLLMPQGVYVSSFINQHYEGTKYYSFNQLKHFRSHLPQKEQDKIAKKNTNGEKYRYRYFLKQESLKEIDDQVVYAVELYQERNSIKNSNRITIFCGFDKNGKLVWDNSFDYKSLKENGFFIFNTRRSFISAPDPQAPREDLPTLRGYPEHMNSSTSIINPSNRGVIAVVYKTLFPVSFGLQKGKLSVANLTPNKFYFAQTPQKEYFKAVEIDASPFPFFSENLSNPQATHWYEDNFLLIGVVKNRDGFELKLLKVR
jgi:hypothetical protein